MNEMTCYICDEDFEYDDADTDITNDIHDGQYVEFEIVRCPHCELSVRV